MRSKALLCILLLLALAGCQDEAPATESSATPTPPPSTAEPTPTPEPQPMIVTLGLWLPQELDPYGTGPGAAILAQQLADFDDVYPGLQIDVTIKESHDPGGLLDFLSTARDAAPSVLPDLIVLDTAEIKPAANRGLIQPLDPLFDPALLADRFPFATALGTVDEQTFGVVVGADMQILAYRPALLASPPISWTQVITPPVTFVFPAQGTDLIIDDATLIQYLAAGGQVTDADGNPWIDESVLTRVLNFYDDAVESGAISPEIVLGIADADQAWHRFQAGWGEITAVRASRFLNEGSPSTAIASLPTEDGRPASVARGWAIALVSQDPERQESAMLLLNWLTAPERNAQWTQAAYYLPGTQSALQLWDLSGANRAALRSVAETALPYPQPATMTVVGPPMQDALEAVLTGKATPKEAATEAADGLTQ